MSVEISEDWERSAKALWEQMWRAIERGARAGGAALNAANSVRREAHDDFGKARESFIELCQSMLPEEVRKAPLEGTQWSVDICVAHTKFLQAQFCYDDAHGEGVLAGAPVQKSSLYALDGALRTYVGVYLSRYPRDLVTPIYATIGRWSNRADLPGVAA